MVATEARLSAPTVVGAMRTLMDSRADRSGRTALLGYLCLKAKERQPGSEIEVRSSGPQSVRPELERFFQLAPGSTTPYVNPFGRREARLQWLGTEYERHGVYTNLTENRTLARVLDVRQEADYYIVRLPATAPGAIARDLKAKLPLEPAVAFLLRREVFPSSVGRSELVERFRNIFHLNDQELDDLFEPMPSFVLEFDAVGLAEGVDALPADLHPPSPSASQAAAVQASEHLVGLAPTDVASLVVTDIVWRRARRALARDRALALVGPPGTGKSRLVIKLIEDARRDPDLFGLSQPPEFDMYAAETDWTARSIVGGYFPQSDGLLVFQEGYLLMAVRRNRWLVLDEMNRADLDRVLGPVLTFLAGQHVDLGRTELSAGGRSMLLAWGNDPESRVVDDDQQRVYVAGTDWRIIGTYNNVDLGRVFSMGAALSRRWATVPVPPLPDEQLPNALRTTGLSDNVVNVIRRVYALHLEILPLGPAPFVDMARFVAEADAAPPPAGAAPDAISVAILESLCDAYILHIGPQLRRLDPEKRQEFIDRLGTILGTDLADELASS